MFKTIKKPKSTHLAFNLLKILNEKYACANEIKQKLKTRHISYPGKDFFPVLSYLLLNKYLCYNWTNETGKQIKYYHLTRNGNSFLKSIAIN